MNQSSDAALIKLLHDTLSAWLKYAKDFNEVHTGMDRLEESMTACRSLAWLHHLPLDHSRALYSYTLLSLEQKLQALLDKESKLKQEFSLFSDSFERKLPPFFATARVYGQALKNVQPGPSCDSYSSLIFFASSLQEALLKQSFFLLNNASNARHEALKFLDDHLANEIQQIYSRYRSA